MLLVDDDRDRIIIGAVRVTPIRLFDAFQGIAD